MNEDLAAFIVMLVFIIFVIAPCLAALIVYMFSGKKNAEKLNTELKQLQIKKLRIEVDNYGKQ